MPDRTLTEDQRDAQLKDFIMMQNNKALQYAIDTVNKGNKKSRQASKPQILSVMKSYCCHVGKWKMSQFKGMTPVQIQGAYYRVKRQDLDFIPMGSEADERKFSKRKVSQSEPETVKKTRIAKATRVKSEEFTEEQLTSMIVIEEEDFYPDPLQVRHPILDWEVYTAKNFAPCWKITRLGGETSSFVQFAELIKACDRDDLDTLWRLVQERFNAGRLKDSKEMQLWVELRRLYEPNKNDKYWKFESSCPGTTWLYYDSSEVHHVSTKNGVDVFMFAEKEYPLKAGTLTVMLASNLRVHEDTEKVRELIRKIQLQCSRAVEELSRKK